MHDFALYSIGHGLRKPEDFVALLRQFDIHYLVDVRSLPYSKFNPGFRQNELKAFLEKNGITYVFMGDQLGGRPKDTACYDPDGRLNYAFLKNTTAFKTGIKRLIHAYKKKMLLAIMCSESKPSQCHRCRLIGIVLSENKIPILHIDEKGRLKDQATVITEANKGRSAQSLFG